jgi:YD repeat-containing protein
VTDPLGKTVTSVYDALNRLLQSVNPLGLAVTSVLAAVDDAIAAIDPLGDYTQHVHDLLHRWAAVDMNGGVVQQGYNAASQVTAVTNAVGNKTSYFNDPLGGVTATTDPLGHNALTAYDAAGRTSTLTDRDGRKQVFHYDNADRLTAVTWLSAAGPTVNVLTCTYDANGNQLTPGRRPAPKFCADKPHNQQARRNGLIPSLLIAARRVGHR